MSAIAIGAEKPGFLDRMRNQPWLIHACMVLLFLIPALVLAIGYNTGVTMDRQNQIQFISVLLTFPVATVMYFRGRLRTGMLLLDLLLLVVLLFGVPGIYWDILNPLQNQSNQMGTTRLRALGDPFEQTIFFFGLVIRSLTLFVLIPRSRMALRYPTEKILIGWLFVVSLIITLGSLWYAQRNGMHLFSAERLGQYEEGREVWLTANAVGLYSAMLGLMCFMAGFVHILFRLPAFGLAMYVLLLSQSRMAIAAFVLCVGLWLAMRYYREIARLAAGLLFVGLILVVAAPAVTPIFLQMGPVQRIVERNNRVDPTAGRIGMIQEAWDRVKDYPFVGGGWSSPGSRFENGLSLAMEIGLVGVALYLFFFFAIVYQGIHLERSRDARGRYLGRIAITLSVFLLFRALTERSHGLQFINVMSTAWMLTAGLTIGYQLGIRAGVIQPEPVDPLPLPEPEPSPVPLRPTPAQGQ